MLLLFDRIGFLHVLSTGTIVRSSFRGFIGEGRTGKPARNGAAWRGVAGHCGIRTRRRHTFLWLAALASPVSSSIAEVATWGHRHLAFLFSLHALVVWTEGDFPWWTRFLLALFYYVLPGRDDRRRRDPSPDHIVH